MSGTDLPPLHVRTREPLTRQESGRIGALKRWGPPRQLNLGDLTPEQRRVILALVEAQRAANEAKEREPGAAAAPPSPGKE